MQSLSQIPGIGPKTEAKLNRLGIRTPHDLLYWFPRNYLDFSHVQSINHLELDTTVTVRGVVQNFQNVYTRSHKNLQKARIFDGTGYLDLVWFNQPFLSSTIKIGADLSFAGVVTEYLGKKTIIAPVTGDYNTGKIIAVYPETKNLNSAWFRKTIQQQLDSLLSLAPVDLPSGLLKKYHLLSLPESLKTIHCPPDLTSLNQARYRLSLDEIMSVLAQSWHKKQLRLSLKPNFRLKNSPRTNSFIKSLPFKLTSSQKKVWREIKSDLISSRPTNRLLQGDVGSGKTVIALLACYLAHLNDHLSLFLSPTEILTQQHFATFQKLLPQVPLFLLTAKSKINFNKMPDNAIIIATHAAIFQEIGFKNKVAVLIIDEQHKFGVRQRSFLNTQNPPHTITMTATPIPRTIGLTLFGNLDISTIDSLPANRLPIKTFLVPQTKVTDCYQWLEQHLIHTREQAFIVCPFIEPSETMITVKSARMEFDHLSKQVFPHLRLALIHGKTPITDRQKILTDFQNKTIDILVTTPIIEVGIDFPNSTTIIIQSADRFGLAQLHQLRGRVGRGSGQSYCYLFTENSNDKVSSRLNFLAANRDGQKIAEFDLKIRGPGEIFSTIQHGFPPFKLASFSDTKLIAAAQTLFKDLITHHPEFEINQLIVSDKSPDILN